MNTELILIRELSISIFNDFNHIKLKKNDILGIYIWGSKLYNTINEKSDLDYCIILKNSKLYESYFQYESNDLDIHFMTENDYLEKLDECDIMALECYFQLKPLLKYNIEFNLNLKKLRKSVSTVANNSFVKFKKKLTIEKDNISIYIGLKSLYHSIRILDFGRDIAESYKKSIDEDIKFEIKNSYQHSVMLNYIFNEAKKYNNNWEDIHKIFKPIFNKYSSEFKKVAPK